MARINIAPIQCAHCGKRPSRPTAQAAVRRYLQRIGRSTCVACGLEISHSAFRVEHVTRCVGERPVWEAQPLPGPWSDFSVVFGPTSMTHAYKIHLGCAQKALPHLNVEALINPRPWRHPSRKVEAGPTADQAPRAGAPSAFRRSPGPG